MVVKYKTDNESEWGSSFGEKTKVGYSSERCHSSRGRV